MLRRIELFRRDPNALGWLVLAFVVALYAYRLNAPHAYVMDEGMYRLSEQQLLRMLRTRPLFVPQSPEDFILLPNWEHPPAAKLFIGLGDWTFGFDKWFSARVGSVVFGGITLFFSWQLARRLGGNRLGLLTLVLLGCDGLLLVMSRTAMLDIYVAGSTVAAVYFCVRMWTEPERVRWACATGAAFGLALACKWSALPIFATAGCATLGALVVHARRTASIPWRRLGIAALCFLGCAPLVYVLTFLPNFATGVPLRAILDLQVDMARFHAEFSAPHLHSSRWYTWPLLLRPMPFFSADSEIPGRFFQVRALGNPVLWWCFLLAIAAAAFRYVRRRNIRDVIVVGTFLALWVPWAAAARMTMLYYFLPAVPFGALAIAMVLDALWEAKRKRLVIGYLMAAGGWLVLFYPVLTAWPVSAALWDSRLWMWFDSWR